MPGVLWISVIVSKREKNAQGTRAKLLFFFKRSGKNEYLLCSFAIQQLKLMGFLTPWYKGYTQCCVISSNES